MRNVNDEPSQGDARTIVGSAHDQGSYPSRRRVPRRAVISAAAVIAVLVPMVAHVADRGVPANVEPAQRSFYVSPQGNDDLDGSSPARAWRSLDRLNAANVQPGDKLLLAGGARFHGTVKLGPDEAGDASRPVVIESYGAGRATLMASEEPGITIYNTAGVEIRNLAIVGDDVAFAAVAGITLYSDLPGDRKLDHVVITGVDVTGFKDGIDIGGGRGATGFRNVRISDSVLHGNRDAGLFSYGPALDPASPSYAHESVSVSGVEVFDNPGDPADHQRTTGNGIVLGSVRGGLVEHSVAHHNGKDCDSTSGPVGIWTYDSTGIVIQHNVSFQNRTGGPTDGGGFDLDRNVTSSVVQYNLSYDNDGPGYLVYGDHLAPAPSGNIVRFNISSNDVRKVTTYGAIDLAGAVNGLQVYHNTVAVSANPSVRPPALLLEGQQTGVTIRDNIFVADGTQLLYASADFPTTKVLLQGNDLFSASDWSVTWGSSHFSALADWRSATGQERADGHDCGMSADPRFVHPSAQTAAGAARADGYVPGNEPVLLAGGVDLRSFGIDPGPVDYFGKPIVGPATVGAVQASAGR